MPRRRFIAFSSACLAGLSIAPEWTNLLILELEQLGLLGIEAETCLAVVQRLHPREQLSVQVDEVIVRGE